jgi:hypothetical protein
MSLLLHIIGNLVFFFALGIAVLTVLTWFTKNTKSDQISRPSLHEWPEDKTTHVDRISARRPTSSRRDSKEERERWRA